MNVRSDGILVIEPTTSDRHVIDAVLAGDREAFRVLVERESQTVIGVCRQILRDPVEAHDVAQDTFVQAYQALATFRGDGPFGAWLRRIAVRAAIGRLAARPDLITLDGETLDPRAAALDIRGRSRSVGPRRRAPCRDHPSGPVPARRRNGTWCSSAFTATCRSRRSPA